MSRVSFDLRILINNNEDGLKEGNIKDGSNWRGLSINEDILQIKKYIEIYYRYIIKNK